MANELEHPQTPFNSVVQRLMRETGIREDQARELVALLGGGNWPSLMREARILRPDR